MTRKCFIFDLDDTLADNGHRMHLLRAGQWDDYFALCHADPPIEATVQCAIALHVRGFPIIIISGRSESVRAETEAWLIRHVCLTERLYLRPVGDFRPNSVVKLEALADLRAAGFEPLMAFDDQPATCAMWRAAGVPCAQVRGEEDFVEYKQGA